MELGLVEYLQGFFSLIFVLITLIIGIKIMVRYLVVKRRQFLLIGLAWFGLAFGWIPDSISFIMIILFDTPISEAAYFIIGISFLPLFVLCFLFGFTDILITEKKKFWIGLFIVLCIIYEIIFWYLFLSPTEAVGTFVGPFQVEYHPLIDIFLLIWIISLLIIGLSFVRQSCRSDKPEMRVRGLLLLIAFLSFIAGAIMDILIPLTPFTVVITRLILTSSSIEFYMGFIMPDWVKNFFLKERET